MTASLDLSRRAWTRVRGALTLIGTWMLNEDRRWRPVMAIIRTGDELTDHTIPCIVTMDKAWIWSEEIGDPRQAARIAHGFAQALRLDEHEPRTVVRLAMLIHDHLGDLLHIPPYVPDADDADVIGEATVTDRRTGATHELEIRDV